MTAPIDSQIPLDCWKLIFQYLSVRDQAHCNRVCKLWNKTLYELQYEYGRFQALRALNLVPPLNLPVPLDARAKVCGVKGPYILLSPQNGPWSALWFIDSHANKSQEIRTDPERSMVDLCAARWVSKDRFVTIQGSRDRFFDIILWRVSKKEDVCQIDQIAQKEFSTRGRVIDENVLPLEHRLFVNVMIREEDVVISFFPLKFRVKRQSLMIDARSDAIEIKEVTDPSYSLYGSYASHSKMVFALDYPGLTVFHLTTEGIANITWKAGAKAYFERASMVNDQWFIAIKSHKISEIPGAVITREEVTFQVFDVLTGQEVFVFEQTYTQCYKFSRIPSWLNGNFVVVFVGKELRIFHIPTRSHLTTIIVSEIFLAPQLTLCNHCPIHSVEIDQKVLRIVYETNDGIQVHQVNLENQHGKPSLPTPQILAPPQPRPLESPTKWARFWGFVSTVISLPIRLWRLVRSVFSS